MFNDEEKNNDINAFESATFEKLTNREKQIALQDLNLKIGVS